MIYKAITTVNRSYESELTEILFAYQAISISSENNHDTCLLTAIFYEIETAKDFLVNNGFLITELDDEEWKYKWLENYNGGEITENIFIQPSESETLPSKDYSFILKLDPRDAFGDGNHPTTKQCAIFLEKELQKNNDKNIKFLDIGTGTGILAIIASFYNLNDVDAIDIEEESVIRTKTNISLNNIKNICVLQADIENFKVSKKYDIICANLLTAIIIKNIENIINLGSDNCIFIFSGIGIQWKEEMELLFTKNKLKTITYSDMDDWCCFLLKK